jgi:hypothetical protein
MNSTAIRQRIQTIWKHSVRRVASLGVRLPHSIRLAVGPLVGFAAFVAPVAAQSGMKGAICTTGVGDLLSVGIGMLALLLAYYSIYDMYGGFKAGQGGDSTTRAKAGSYYQAGGKKLAGSVVIAGSPDFLSALGFSLLDCVSVAQIFAT